MLVPVDLQQAADRLEELIGKASREFDRFYLTDDPWDDPSWLIEKIFIQLLAALEALDMPELRRLVHEEYEDVKSAATGFARCDEGPAGGPYSPVLGRLRLYKQALDGLLPQNPSSTVTKDLQDIVRNALYAITDSGVFGTVPKNEKDVHDRMEAVLKCVFPDLKSKPSLSKQIKNFIPDTGIPSLKTLIEYKFLSAKEKVGVIADQILADTRGYVSTDWDRFLYVIYETNRFRTESDWNQLMRDSGIAPNTTVIVLTGEPIE